MYQSHAYIWVRLFQQIMRLNIINQNIEWPMGNKLTLWVFCVRFPSIKLISILTTDNSWVDNSLTLTRSTVLWRCRDFSGTGLGTLSIAVFTFVSNISFFCWSLLAWGGFSGMVGWIPSIHSQWAKNILIYNNKLYISFNFIE